ncbi:MAG: CoA transferase [Burkholderiaceae bacterium]
MAPEASGTYHQAMYSILNGLQIVEASSFVAAPSCAMHLASLGARVIRIDPIGGGLDFNRYPRAHNGASLYWEGLQKNKQSIAINLREAAGRELAAEIITAPGENAGLFVTNFPRDGFLSHERLSKKRSDLITIRVQGWADGRSGLDYTINAITGYPYNTGPEETTGPVNHVMPGWDLLTGALGGMHLLAAERHRRSTGLGQEIALPLSSVAISSLGALGQLAEVEVLGQNRPRLGNNVFGAFGRDFETRDGRHVMVVAITPKQWDSILDSLKIRDQITRLETQHQLDLRTDEAERFEHRDLINPLVSQAIAAQPYDAIAQLFDDYSVCWGPYQSLEESMASHEELQAEHPMMSTLTHPSGARYRTPGNPAQYSGQAQQTPRPASALGADSVQVLSDTLGLSQAAIGQLIQSGIVATAAAPAAGARPASTSE